ncbi:MAG: tetratricopeptide repeat protein [Acidobacteria bacterium]|nr:tetratricopeptide repeat protein [Acidobacteriota bacterium]
MVQTNRIALLQKAEDAARKGEYDEALGIVSRCLDLYPGFSPARVLKSEILSRTGSIDAAVEELREIIAANPENIRARMILTELLIQKHDQKQAMVHLEFLAFMVPENDPALLDLRQRAEALQRPPEQTADKQPETLEFGIVEGDGEEHQETQADNVETADADEDIILEDEVTEIFLESELTGSVPDSSSQSRPADGDVLKLGERGQSAEEEIAESIDDGLEEIPEEETVVPDEIVTVRVPEENAESVEVSSGNDVEIKTLTMARVYERQKMYREALDILETLYRREGTDELAAELQRVRELAGGTGSSRKHIIIKLENWVEKITCNSAK